MNYYNVITEKYDKVSVPCTVRRSPEIPISQTRDLQLDLQINRLTAAAAMEEAQTQKDMNQARKVVTTAISRIKTSLTVEDPYTQTLVEDLEEILGDMKDASSFQRVAVAKMNWKGNAHMNQRAAGTAGVSYQNAAKKSMQMKSHEYSSNYESDSKVKSKAATKSKSNYSNSKQEKKPY